MSTGARSSARRCVSRPPLTAPMGTIRVWALFFLVWGSLAPVTATSLGLVLRQSYDTLDNNFLLVLTISAVPIVAIAWGFRSGAIWSLFALRFLIAVAFTAATLNLVAGVLLAMGVLGFPEMKSQHTGLFVCVCACIELVLSVALFLSARKVRWLDPYSTPDEWERPINPAARRGI